MGKVVFLLLLASLMACSTPQINYPYGNPGAHITYFTDSLEIRKNVTSKFSISFHKDVMIMSDGISSHSQTGQWFEMENSDYEGHPAEVWLFVTAKSTGLLYYLKDGRIFFDPPETDFIPEVPFRLFKN